MIDLAGKLQQQQTEVELNADTNKSTTTFVLITFIRTTFGPDNISSQKDSLKISALFVSAIH